MALLPDFGTAALYAVVVFLIGLGILVVFVESIPRTRALGFVAFAAVLAVFIGLLGEVGVALLFVAAGAAVVANQAFEWLTTRR